MTVDLTRLLGIEFERRVQLIDPRLISLEKLDTDTIYSFLSLYLYRYVKALYLTDDQLKTGSRAQRKIADTVKSLLKRKILSVNYDTIQVDEETSMITKNIVTAQLPNDYFLYIRSNSIISSNYKSSLVLSQKEYTPNILIKLDEAESVLYKYYNTGAIMKNPCVVLTNVNGDPYMNVIHDLYTTIDNIDLTYYRIPYNFNVLNFDNSDTSIGATHNFCELPFNCFNELVEGAVDLFITEAKFRLLTKQPDLNNNQNEQKQLLEDLQ